jgi:endonuclease/exonuclease/phosphatase family metal-dependent hydrolase
MSPKLKKIARFGFIAINIITILLYLSACLVPFVEAGKHPYIALTGLSFPLLLLVLILFGVYWLIRRSKWFFVCLAALVPGWQQASVLFELPVGKDFVTEKKPGTLRVLTWNLSSWGETNRGNNKNNMDSMVSLIKNSNADVVCFQEYIYYKNKQYRDTIIPALRESGYQYAYFAKTNVLGRLYTTSFITAIVVLSKYPITDTARFMYNADNFSEPLACADIKINNQTIRFITTHLQSVRFASNDYEALHNLKEPVTASIDQTRSILWKIRHAYIKRSIQAKLVHEKITESPYPVIMCGDFNDVPNSFTYFTIKGDLQDAFLQKGSGFGRTFRLISPTLRIDYILADKKFEVLQYNTFTVPYSDHYPVVADFDIGEKK